jgi:hypothetical protein
MVFRYTQAGKFAALLSLASLSMAFHPAQLVPSAPPVAAPPSAAEGPTLNILGLPTPKKGKPYRFNLCTGQAVEATAVSRVCSPADAAKTVTGAAPGVPINFRIADNSLLPPGLSLDGNGVLSGTADADLSKKSVHICATQSGAIGGSSGCTGQAVRFDKLNIRSMLPAQAAKAGGGGVGTAIKLGAGLGGGVAGALVLANALKDLKSAESDVAAASAGSSSSSSSSSTATANYSGTVTYSCTAGAGAAEPCNRAPSFSGCSNSTITFSVSGGVLTDTCGWLTRGSVSSNVYSGRYTGTASQSMPMTGTVSSGAVWSGTDTFKGNTYRITIAVQSR